MDTWDLLYRRLPKPIGQALCALSDAEAQKLEEIRFYADAPPELVIDGMIRPLCVRVEMQQLLAALSAQALYSCEGQMARGFIPLPGGHRAGVCGRMCIHDDGTVSLTEVSAVCIRVGRWISDVSLPVRPFLLNEKGVAQRVLVLGAPGSGKTTLLRDAALWLAGHGQHVAVADERGELFSGHMPKRRLNVLSGLDKARAFSMLLRAMAPQVIVSDELGADEDTAAVLDVVRCGVGLLVSAHAADMQEASRRPAIRRLMAQEAFDWYILLGRHAQVRGVYDHAGNRWEENGCDQLECGSDDDDGHQRGRLSAFGW
ncbi:MAG: hypothetical protein IKU38_07320 [Clostridia bacterium]|nr:hypothetical protein [Clostridia bacterium]